MVYDTTTNRVKPDPRLGEVELLLESGGCVFIWRDAKTGVREDEYHLTPTFVRFEKVKQSTGRVYLLNFIGTTRRIFFWMQVKISLTFSGRQPRGGCDNLRDRERADQRVPRR